MHFLDGHSVSDLGVTALLLDDPECVRQQHA